MFRVTPRLFQPLFVDTNISYELDMSKFPGLDDPQQMYEPSLLIAAAANDFVNNDNDASPTEDVSTTPAVNDNDLLHVTVSSDLVGSMDPITYQCLFDDVTQDISSCSCFDFLDVCTDTDSDSTYASTWSASDMDSVDLSDSSMRSPVEPKHCYRELPTFSHCIENGHCYRDLLPFNHCIGYRHSYLDLPPFSHCIGERHSCIALPPFNQCLKDGHSYRKVPPNNPCIRDVFSYPELHLFNQRIEDRHSFRELPSFSQCFDAGHIYGELTPFSPCPRDANRRMADDLNTKETAKKFKMADQSSSQMCFVSSVCPVMNHTVYDRGS